MRSPVLLFCAATATALVGGCDLLKSNWGSEVSFTIDRERTAAGQVIDVTFEKLNDEDGKRFWIAIQPEDASNLDLSGRIPIAKGAGSMQLTASKPCACEVRVYTETSAGQNMIVARKKLRVVE